MFTAGTTGVPVGAMPVAIVCLRTAPEASVTRILARGEQAHGQRRRAVEADGGQREGAVRVGARGVDHLVGVVLADELHVGAGAGRPVCVVAPRPVSETTGRSRVIVPVTGTLLGVNRWSCAGLPKFVLLRFGPPKARVPVSFSMPAV